MEAGKCVTISVPDPHDSSFGTLQSAQVVSTVSRNLYYMTPCTDTSN
jgi:hypothetical protein